MGCNRRSWSNIGTNNKNFPDGKLGYESSLYDSGGGTGVSSSVAGMNKNKYSAVATAAKGSNATKFERSSQDVMARASQIVQ